MTRQTLPALLILTALAGLALAQSVYVQVYPAGPDPLPGQSPGEPVVVERAVAGVLILRQDARLGSSNVPYAVPVDRILVASPAPWWAEREDGSREMLYTTRLGLADGSALYVAEEWHEMVPRLVEAGWGAADFDEPLERWTHPEDRG